MNNKSNKQSKRKLFIIVLLLFMVITVTGYGAYSYFYTTGNFGASGTISVASFDPEVDITSDFVGHGGSITLTCPESSSGSGTVNCTGSLSVSNNGGTDITVAASNGVATVSPITSDSATATAGTPTFAWSSTTITPGDSATLTITVPVTLSSEFADSDSHYRDSAYEGEAIEVTVDFDITATQVHN